MNLSSIIHEPKSHLAYAYNKSTLHIRLKTAKDDVIKVKLLAADQFDKIPNKENNNIYEFNRDSICYIDMIKEYTTELYDYWFAEISNFIWLRIRYCFIIENQEQCYILGQHEIVEYNENKNYIYDTDNYYNFPYINEEDIYKAPDWIKNTIWYQIFPERFCHGKSILKENIFLWETKEEEDYNHDKRYGGNLQGIIDKLDYIKDIGFNGIYLNPIFKSPSSHKYDTTNYYEIDSNFGDNNLFKELVKQAHKRKIKILLDAVFNHCGFFHPYWQDVLKNGVNSKYIDWFHILDRTKPILYGELKNGFPEKCSKENLNYRTFAFTQMMPKWNTQNTLARQYLLDIAVYWVEKYDIDGWRLDVSNEVSHDFWREFRKKVKSIKPDIYILGENWDNSYQWLLGEQFDAVMNYGFMTPIWNFFGTNKNIKVKYTAEKFKNYINKLLVSYPKNVSQNMFNLLGSHDTDRILTICSNNYDLVKLCYVFQMTFSGCPSIYYGDEIGLNGTENNNRKCMIWNEEKQNKDLLDTIKKLINIRKHYKSCLSVDLEWIFSDNNTNCIIYKKKYINEILYIIINNSSFEQIIKLNENMKNQNYLDIYYNYEIKLKDNIKLPPYDFKILTSK